MLVRNEVLSEVLRFGVEPVKNLNVVKTKSVTPLQQESLDYIF